MQSYGKEKMSGFNGCIYGMAITFKGFPFRRVSGYKCATNREYMLLRAIGD